MCMYVDASGNTITECTFNLIEQSIYMHIIEFLLNAGQAVKNNSMFNLLLAGEESQNRIDIYM